MTDMAWVAQMDTCWKNIFRPKLCVNYFEILEWLLEKIQRRKVVDLYVYYLSLKFHNF